MAAEIISSTQCVSPLAVPPPVKHSNIFAIDLNEAEQATLSKPKVLLETNSTIRPFTNTRTSSNASSTSSNATTLVDKDYEVEQLSPTQGETFHDDDCRLRPKFIGLRCGLDFHRLVSSIGFWRVKPRVKKAANLGDEVFVNEQCDERYPMGWPRLAAFQNRSDSCAVYRRFGLLFCRVLLQLQAEINGLEKKLLQLDTQDAANESMHYRLRSIDDSEKWDPAQRNILKQIQEKLSIYGDLLEKDAKLRELGPAPSRNHLNVYNWMCRNRPLEEGHDDFIFRKEDFITPTKKCQHGNGISDFIEACISRRPQCLFKATFGFKEQGSDREEGTYLFSRRRIAFVANIIVVWIAISVLLIPVFVLYMASITRVQSAGVVLVFTVLFATMISLLTDGKVENVFMSTCGYCAVLVVFLSNVEQSIGVAPSSGQG